MALKTKTYNMRLKTITLCFLTAIVTSCYSVKSTNSNDQVFFDVNGPVYQIVWCKSSYDYETQSIGSPETTTYRFDAKGNLIKLDEYDAFVDTRKDMEDLSDFLLGFFRGEDGYICKQSLTGGMSAYETYEWQNGRISAIDYICTPHQEEMHQHLNYDSEGRLTSADCLHSGLDADFKEKQDSFVIDYEYVSFDNNANWTERKGWVDKKLFVHETREITYESAE